MITLNILNSAFDLKTLEQNKNNKKKIKPTVIIQKKMFLRP